MLLRPEEPAIVPAFVSHQVTAAQRFYLNLKPAASHSFTVVCGGRETCAPDYVVRRTSFPFHALEFVVAGEGEVVLRGRTHPLRAGVVFCYGPRVRHEICSSRAAPLEKYFVDFAGRDAPRRLREAGLASGGAIQVLAVGDVRGEFDALLRFGRRKDRRTERTCALQLELLLHTIARAGATGSIAERRARAAFERCRQHIDAHFTRLQSLAEVAAECHLERSHVCRLFKRFHDDSPLQYLLRRRMHWAADRLQEPGVLVREVADELRLDAFHFSRAFKRVHGVSPLAFLATRA